MDPQFKQGVKAAAAVASAYNSVSAHQFRLDDCILMKLNVSRRRNPRKNRHAEDKWLCGFGLAMAELSRTLGRPSAIKTIMREAGVTIPMLKRAGLDEYDLNELQQL